MSEGKVCPFLSIVSMGIKGEPIVCFCDACVFWNEQTRSCLIAEYLSQAITLAKKASATEVELNKLADELDKLAQKFADFFTGFLKGLLGEEIKIEREAEEGKEGDTE